MNNILFIIQKEFIQIFRNKTMLPIIFVLPIMQLLILVHAANYELKNIDIVVYDKDNSQYSRELISKFEASPFFNIAARAYSPATVDEYLYANKAELALVFPTGFEKDLVTQQKTQLQIQINAIDGMVAGLANAYVAAIVNNYNKSILPQIMPISANGSIKSIQVDESYWYNPELNYKSYMVPGILVLLVTLIGIILSSMNLVREKELGTIEQINVTPVKKYEFIAGKLFPFLIIGLVELAFGLTIGFLLFHIPIVGSLFLVFGVAVIYLILVMGLGLLLSTVSSTQQQTMFVAFFFIMIFILMSGLFTDVGNMPDWAKNLNRINPIAYFIKIMRMVLLKGSELRHIKQEVTTLAIYAICIFSMAVWRYKKRA
ncbi:MAG: ABC transporter permease [Bacteroidales bacterium]|nr:ABC transporter permease [Bacteroidales bacterium]